MTPFQDIYELFASKVTSYDLFSLSDEELKKIFKKYLNSSSARFVHCNKDLSDRNEDLEQFNESLSSLEQEILSLHMIQIWLDSHVRSEDFLKQRLGNRDYGVFSPANHLDKLIALSESVGAEIGGLTNLYYYAT